MCGSCLTMPGFTTGKRQGSTSTVQRYGIRDFELVLIKMGACHYQCATFFPV